MTWPTLAGLVAAAALAGTARRILHSPAPAAAAADCADTAWYGLRWLGGGSLAVTAVTTLTAHLI